MMSADLRTACIGYLVETVAPVLAANKMFTPDRLRAAWDRAASDLLSEMGEGHWQGCLSASALSTATALSALGLYRRATGAGASGTLGWEDWMEEQVRLGRRWLLDQQNADGGWGDTDLSHSNIATTMLAVAALKLSTADSEALHTAIEMDSFRWSATELPADSALVDVAPVLQRACRYVGEQGGIAGLRNRYGKDKTFAVPILANCAMAELVRWQAVSALPFELACVPQKFYRFVQMPVVSYAVPALVAIGQCKFLADPPWNPFLAQLRRLAIPTSLRVLQRMQPASGGYLEAIPLTCFVAMALIHSGRADHAVVLQALEFIRTSFRPEGSWPIDTNLATWVTTLSINALAPAAQGVDAPESDAPCSLGNNLGQVRESVMESVDWPWLLDCQYKEVHPFTGSAPGGWGWSNLSGAVPDADDTPGALLALRSRYTWLQSIDTARPVKDRAAPACVVNDLDANDSERSTQLERIVSSAVAGCRWLLDLQNRDRGWPTFCRGWGRLPFDRSGADITAHAMRALLNWRDVLEQAGELRLVARIDRATGLGLHYLLDCQRADGSWVPLWFGNQDHPEEENPVYGTAKIITALACVANHRNRVAEQMDWPTALRRAVEWMLSQQDESGGWGGGRSIGQTGPRNRGTVDRPTELGNSSVEETGLAVESLIECYPVLRGVTETGADSQPPAVKQNTIHDRVDQSLARGTAWLIRSVECGLHQRSWPIGFYFAKLWYYEKLYPQVFAAAALGRAVNWQQQTG